MNTALLLSGGWLNNFRQSLRPYVAVFAARFQLLLQYRAAAAAGIACQFFWGLIRIMIFSAFYENSSAIAAMDLNQTRSYVWLSQAMLMLIPFRPDGELAGMINSGNVAYQLLRPVGLYKLWYARELASRTAPVLLRAVPMLVIVTLTGGISWPGASGVAAFLLAAMSAAILAASVSMLMTISMFWTLSGRGVSLLFSPTMFLMSGMIIPIPLFPDFLQPLLRVLPFAGIIDMPIRIFIGHIPPQAAFGVLAHQLTWAAGLICFGCFLISRSMSRLVVQGG